MTNQIQDDVVKREITRLCHFTSSVSFLHVLQSGFIKDRATLDREQNRVVNPTDELRLDGHREAICCTIEYPNTYYLENVTQREKLFDGWIILFIDVRYLSRPGTMFCEKNAAAGCGSFIKEGIEGFQAMFPLVARGYPRKAMHLACSPTDLQAEVLIPGPVPLNAITGMAMKSDRQVETELVRWESVGLARPDIPIFVAPKLFQKFEVRDHIFQGRRPMETLYEH